LLVWRIKIEKRVEVSSPLDRRNGYVYTIGFQDWSAIRTLDETTLASVS
jgi:hypothetical protein